MSPLNLLMLYTALCFTFLSTFITAAADSNNNFVVRSKRSPQFFGGYGVGGLYGLGIGGLYSSLYGGDSLLGLNGYETGLYSSYPSGYWDRMGQSGGGGSRYKRSAFFGGPTVGYGAGLGGGYGLGLGGGLGGFGLGLGGFGGIGGSGAFGGLIGGYPSAYPGNYVGLYDTTPVKLGARGDSYANQNYKPYALRATIDQGLYGS